MRVGGMNRDAWGELEVQLGDREPEDDKGDVCSDTWDKGEDWSRQQKARENAKKDEMKKEPRREKK